MRFVPHEYQRYCTEYIKTHSIAALFLDMGLGKTVITLSAIKDLMLETFEVSKVLIIAPLRVARDTWPAELEKWDHLKGLDISVIVGDVKTRIAAVHHPAMIYIVNRENIKWLVEYYEKNGMRWDFGMVVIDELSSFKNYQSHRECEIRGTGQPCCDCCWKNTVKYMIFDFHKFPSKYQQHMSSESRYQQQRQRTSNRKT